MEYHIKEKNDEYTNLLYIDNILPEELLMELKEKLKILDFKSENKIDREQIWFQKEGHYFCREWKNRYPRWESNNYDETILKVQTYLQENFVKNIKKYHHSLSEFEINSCLINRYIDGNKFISPHKDTPKSFGTTPTIIGLSIGAERTLKIQKIKSNDEYSFRLKDNSIFIMAGASQKYYLHSVPKENCDKIRWSLTFRKYI